MQRDHDVDRCSGSRPSTTKLTNTNPWLGCLRLVPKVLSALIRDYSACRGIYGLFSISIWRRPFACALKPFNEDSFS